MKVQKYIILVLACALIITLVLWNNERKEAGRYRGFVEISYQKSLIDLTLAFSEAGNLTEEIKKDNYRDELMNIAIENQLASLGRISADLSTITAAMKTKTPLSEKLRMHSLHPIEKGYTMYTVYAMASRIMREYASNSLTEWLSS